MKERVSTEGLDDRLLCTEQDDAVYTSPESPGWRARHDQTNKRKIVKVFRVDKSYEGL
jgi:hypothetical protein